jgi:hypothetical protein
MKPQKFHAAAFDGRGGTVQALETAGSTFIFSSVGE